MKTSSSRAELDSMIVGIELTLVSIIQGVALYFLIEGARGLMSMGQIVFWPYILAGLLVIFVFWSRSVVHIITLIRWPLEFGHNFLYITCALIEAILFTRLANPFEWFTFAAIFGAVGWMLFVYDLRLIRARISDSAGPANNRLCALVTRDQKLNIAVLLPAVFLLNLACAAVIHTWPEPFLAHGGHVWLIAAQLAAFGGYLLYVVRYFTNLAPLIADARLEWHAARNSAA